jgi:hypothetical protein
MDGSASLPSPRMGGALRYALGRAAILASLGTLLLGGCAMPALRVKSVGTYTGEFVAVPNAAAPQTGKAYWYFKTPQFDGDASLVFANVDTHFGALFVFEGPQPRQRVWYKVVWRYTPDKTQGDRVFYEQDEVTNVGRENTTGIHFNEASQVVEGQFVLEIWQQSQRLFRQEFAVVTAKVALN